jgi:RNA polymerase sigma-70 factor, ECF subfamily
LSHNTSGVRISSVDTVHEAIPAESTTQAGRLTLEELFHAHYDGVARVIARVIRDSARAEELAVDLFLRWPARDSCGEFLQARLYRAAARAGLDELRRRSARSRYESLIPWIRRSSPPTPEQILDSEQEQDRVRAVLAALPARHAELLLLRNEGLSYKELAAATGVQASSAGTLLARAQDAFRKEYVKRYGQR